MTKCTINIPAINVPAAKMNGLGNAILIIDMRGQKTHLSTEFVRHLASFPKTAFDQLMILRDKAVFGREHPYKVEIRNADGTEAKACGNGIRCLAEWLHRQINTAEPPKKDLNLFHFATKGGLVTAEKLKNGQIKVNMGKPNFDPRAIPLNFVPQNMLSVPLADLLPPALKSGSAALPADFYLFPQKATVLSIGNPHAVFFLDNPPLPLENYPLAEFGAALEHSPVFGQGVNVSLAEIQSPTALRLRVWERGAGLTKACGTAACATAAAAQKQGLTTEQVTVELPGGKLDIDLHGQTCFMTGATEYEYGGVIHLSTGAFTRQE